ncbi:hypothetical protein VTH06DRAFT_6414 [Thermothelomyces fergusii]
MSSLASPQKTHSAAVVLSPDSPSSSPNVSISTSWAFDTDQPSAIGRYVNGLERHKALLLAPSFDSVDILATPRHMNGSPSDGSDSTPSKGAKRSRALPSKILA